MRILVLAASMLALVAALPIEAHAQAFSPEGANRYVAAKDWNGLLRYSRTWTAAEPGNATAWFYLGNTYGVGLKDYPDATRAFERCVALSPQWAQAFDALGSAYVQNGEYARGAAAFERALQLSPRSPNYWNNLAAAYSDQNRFDLELEVLNRGVQISGPYADAHNWYVFGNAYHRMRKEREAIYAYDRAIALNRNFAEAYNNRGSAEQLLNNYDAAISDYRRAAALGDGLGSQNAITLQQGLADGGGGSTPNSTNAAISLNNGILQQRAIDYMQNHPGVTHDDAVQSVNRGGM